MLQEETHITRVIDPWGGSYMMEALTEDLVREAYAIIQVRHSRTIDYTVYTYSYLAMLLSCHRKWKTAEA